MTYPCCHYLHAFLDGALALRQAHDVEPEAIERAGCLVPAAEVGALMRLCRA